jgi:hypothetical protein
MIKKALTIGINYTNTSNELYGCIEDIINMTTILTTYYGYDKENIVQLRDDSKRQELQPTAANIVSNLQKLVNESGGLNELWIHYSGHGSQIRDRNGDEQDRLDEVIVPIDYQRAGFIPDDMIFDIIKNVKCRTILIFDSCHSGSLCDLKWSFEFNGSGFIKTMNTNKDIVNPFIYCFSGCKDPQTSADSFSDEYKRPMGAFTNALLFCLKQNNYDVSILKLYAEISSYLAKNNYTQKPVLSCSSVNPSLFFKKWVAPPSPPAPPVTSVPVVTPPLVAPMNVSLSSIIIASSLAQPPPPAVPIKNGMPMPMKSARKMSSMMFT